MSVDKPAKPAAPVHKKVSEPDATHLANKDRVDRVCEVFESEGGTD